MGIPDATVFPARLGRRRGRFAGAGRASSRLSTDRADLPKWQAFIGSDAHYLSDFRPEWFGDKLDRTTLLDVLDGGRDYRIVIEGSEIARRFSSCESHTYRETYAPDYLDEARTFFASVVASGKPARRIVSAIAADGVPVIFSQLAMPAINRSGIVHRLALVVDFLKTPPRSPLVRMFAPAT